MKLFKVVVLDSLSQDENDDIESFEIESYYVRAECRDSAFRTFLRYHPKILTKTIFEIIDIDNEFTYQQRKYHWSH